MDIELRFFRERYDMDPNYYLGNNDVYCRLYFKDFAELKECWERLMTAHDYYLQGETYSAWCNGKVLCGGAFDPGDIEIIAENY